MKQEEIMKIMLVGDIKMDVDTTLEARPINEIRINPTKPTFKVGNWVRDKSSGFITQAYEDMIANNFELWQPVKDELCVFWDNNIEEYFIGKYGTQILISTFGTEFDTEHYLYDKDNWDNVAPLEYIQQFITRESRW